MESTWMKYEVDRLRTDWRRTEGGLKEDDLQQESSRMLEGFMKDYIMTIPGLLKDSTRTPCGLNMDSRWTTPGFLIDSTRNNIISRQNTKEDTTTIT
jgi:hypothetical protein